MDDIAITSKTGLEGHIVVVTDVLQVANEHNLYFKLEKCVFHTSSIDYLGVILEEGVTQMDPVKVNRVQQWPMPQNVANVCSFLGFCNFYQMFILELATHTKPLTMLMKKTAEWQWNKEEDKVINNIKILVTSEPVLAHPKLDKPFELEVDASGYAIRVVLLQHKEDKKQHTIVYFLATLNAAEWNYNIYNLELLAILHSLEHW